MHNAAFAALGMDAVYVPLETADGDEFLAVADAIGVAGASITAPLKPAMFERASTLDDLSTRTVPSTPCAEPRAAGTGATSTSGGSCRRSRAGAVAS